MFFIDSASSLPPYVQLKEQIKVAYATGKLKQGDVLPSVRALARQVGVGEAAVRRAYRELCELSILSTERRKHVAVNHNLVKPPEIEKLMAEAEAQCQSCLNWTHESGLSSLSFARLLMRRAATREAHAPAYAYVDAGTSLALTAAEKIERAWEIKVAGLSIQDIDKLPKEDVQRFTAILVNAYRYETLLDVLGSVSKLKIFPVRIKQSERVIRRIRHLPVGSTVLLVHADEDFPRIGRSVAENFRDMVGNKVHIEGMALGTIADLAELARTSKYRLVIVSNVVWDQIPEKAKRLSMVVRSQSEPDLQSLEEIRIQAGVLI